MWFFTHVWILPAVMAGSFLLILLFGKRLPFKGAEVGITAVSICLLFALATAFNWATWGADSPTVSASAPAEQVEATELGALAEVPDQCSNVVTELREGEGGGATEAAPAGGGTAPAGEGAAPAAVSGTGETAAPVLGSAPSAGGKEEETVTRPVVRCVDWVETAGESLITWGTQIDGLSVMMIVVVTIISLLVHIFSTDYVHGDRRYTHYFAFLSLFTGSMLFFVLSQSTLQMIVGWELVGVCSFALIGHWWEEKPNSDAALKAFLTNRVGDVGLLVGMIILFFAAGQSFSIMDVNILAQEGEIRHVVLLAASVCLITAVMRHNDATSSTPCRISPSWARMLMSRIENDFPAAKNNTIMPTSRPTSPTRLVRNALSAASELGFSSHQWPISANEQTPTSSQPTIICRVLCESTKKSIEPVNRDRNAK